MDTAFLLYILRYCGLYCRAVCITNQNPRFIIESGFKSRAGYNGARTVIFNSVFLIIEKRWHCAINLKDEPCHEQTVTIIISFSTDWFCYPTSRSLSNGFRYLDFRLNYSANKFARIWQKGHEFEIMLNWNYKCLD